MKPKSARKTMWDRAKKLGSELILIALMLGAMNGLVDLINDWIGIGKVVIDVASVNSCEWDA